MDAIQDAFGMLDQDENGVISIDDLKTMAANFGIYPTKKELESIMAEMNGTDNDGVSIDGFSKAMTSMDIPDDDDVLQMTFEMLASNDSGFITTADLEKILTVMHLDITDNELQDMMDEFDYDGNGRIGVEEFIAAMTDEQNYIESRGNAQNDSDCQQTVTNDSRQEFSVYCQVVNAQIDSEQGKTYENQPELRNGNIDNIRETNMNDENLDKFAVNGNGEFTLVDDGYPRNRSCWDILTKMCSRNYSQAYIL